MTWVIATAVVSVVAVIALAEESGWLRRLAVRLLKRVVRALPATERDRYEDEWLAELEVLPGSGVASVVFAVRVALRVRSVRRALDVTDKALAEDLSSPGLWWSNIFLLPGAARLMSRKASVPADDVQDVSFRGVLRTGSLVVLQWALEDAGWRVVRLVLDFVIVCVAVLIAFGGRAPLMRLGCDQVTPFLLPFLVVSLSFVRGTYRRKTRSRVRDEIIAAIAVVSVATIAAAVLGVALDHRVAELGLWVRAWFLASLGVALGRVLLVMARYLARIERLIGKPVLVLGTDVAKRLQAHPEYGLMPLGLVDDPRGSRFHIDARCDIPVLGTVDDVEHLVGRVGVRDLVVDYSIAGHPNFRFQRSRWQRWRDLDVNVMVMPHTYEIIDARHTIFGLPALTAVDPRALRLSVKYALDRILAAMTLLILSPLLIATAITVKLSRPGPVLIKQRRLSRDGTVLGLYRFGSTREPEHSGHDTSLEKLPQLFNVLRGELSLVGPTTEHPQTRQFQHRVARRLARSASHDPIKPGITGLSQLHGLDDQTPMLTRVSWDNRYMQAWSLRFDATILTRAILAQLRHSK
jgi:lipopolysaccharide/colanic/teichoic acid biosynthesis glycosyltransferase